MKVFLLAITILLLISRIKSTPRMLSRTIYENDAKKSMDKTKEKIDNIETVADKEDVLKITQCLSAIFAWLCSMLIIIYYILVGNRFSSNQTMLMLTALQIVTMFISTKSALKGFNLIDFEGMKNNIKFYRLWFLFNVVLDYVYYPMTIYLLLNT